MALTAGTRLGPYEILSLLGAGGMGEVYRARDLRLGREVAIKVLPERLAQDPAALARFEQEARAVAALSHPNILAIHDFGTDNGVSFAVMELLEGESLRCRLARSAMPWRKAAEIAVTLADGLSAAHAKGMVHRDLKPENIFLTSDGRVKILDFGLAQWKPPVSAHSQPTALTESLRTDPGTVMGTIGYMSPEQVRGAPVDARSDIFALGSVLYEMLSGERAFSRPTAAETMAAILNEDPPVPKGSGKQNPAELDAVIAHCLEKNPPERFHSAHDLAFALRAILRGSGGAKAVAAPRRSKAIDSLAVLPFLNASTDPNAEYLSDGITESLINALSQLPKVRVTARSTVFRYKARDADPPTIGRELNVRALLMGRVVTRGDVLSIQADLVDVESGAQLWGERYNRKLSDIFELEEEIARQISEKLRMKLTGEERKRLAKRQTENTEAYQLYLKGRYHWNKRTREGMFKSIEYFQQAIEKDPGYALAYVGLGDAYVALAVYAEAPPKEYLEKWRTVVAKALAIDPALIEAQTSLACVTMTWDWDLPSAEKQFQRIIQRHPNYALARHWFAHCLEGQGRLDEAIAEVQRGLQVDPLSLTLNAHLGNAFYLARRYDQAIEQFHKTLEIDPNFFVAHLGLALACTEKGMYEQAIAAAQKAIEVSQGGPWAVAALGRAYARSGRREEAQGALEDLKDSSKRPYLSSYHVATVYTDLGEQDLAFEWLEKACQERNISMAYIKTEPSLDSLRSDPRFRDLIQRIGLEP